ncbi:hypothetical protein Uis1B_2221 [Bifidobacterium margollesii]|uniref:Single-stranded DNA-binding protein n=1 Tax=Bifidobacterium margollesii TaxID=2020964 RepID=A0A2N5J6X4_9BIFI|nr:hypothetical protein [Bifidobacterium margollesii]PLS29953.1 hypothetical protein Uis1B_2221 [Bifidobacterium margollesii]
MSALTGGIVVSGNLAAPPACFPARDGMPAMSDMRLLTRRRRRDPATGEWVTLDEPALTIVRCYRSMADTVARLAESGGLPVGAPLIVVGAVADSPELWFRDDGAAQAANLMIGERIGLDLIAMRRREDARARTGGGTVTDGTRTEEDTGGRTVA